VLAAHPLEQHRGRARLGEPAGELLAVIGQHLGRNPVSLHRRSERLGDRPRGRDRQHRRADNVAGVVIDAGQHLAFAAVSQVDPADQVQLPQRHRRLPGPPPVLALMHLGLRRHHRVADQDPVHRRPRRRSRHAPLRHLERDPPGTPPRMRPPQLAYQRLGLRRQPRRRGPRPPRDLTQPVDPRRGVPGLPRIHRLPRHPVPDRHLADRRPVQHLQHRPVPLLNQPDTVILLLLCPHEQEIIEITDSNCQASPDYELSSVPWALTRHTRTCLPRTGDPAHGHLRRHSRHA